MKTYSALLIIVLLFSDARLEGQSFRFDHFTIKEGLSQSQPYSIFQDSFGYVWIGTQDGLNRFDGHQFKVYKNDPFDSTTLTHNWVWSVAEDNNKDIWVGTYQGLCKYDRRTDKFVQYYHSELDPASISGNKPNYIVKDKKGRLWISSWGNGLNLYDEKSNSFRHFKHDSKDSTTLSDNFIRTLFCDNDGTVWIGTWNGGLNKMVDGPDGIRFEHFGDDEAAQSVSRILSIAEDKAGMLWVCSNDKGLVLFNPATKKFASPIAQLQKDVNKVICDASGNMWIGSNSCVYHYNFQTRSFKSLKHDATDPHSISGNSIYAIMEDRNGIVWIGGNGLDLYDPRKMAFETFRNNPANPASLSDNMVWSFCEDDDQNIWIGTEADHVDVFNPSTKTVHQVYIKDQKGNVASHIYKMVFHDGIFWIASFKAGLVRYEKVSGKTTFFMGTHPSPLGSIALVNELLMDEDNTLWIGTEEDGLIHYDPSTEKVDHYRLDKNDLTTIASNWIKSIHRDRIGNIWITFSGAGFSMLDRKSNTFRNYHYDGKNANGLSDQLVSSIMQQDDSIFWLCTHSGLNRLNINTGKFSHFFEKDGLANNTTYEMLKDRDGNYWISTNGGISKFNPHTVSFKNYTAEDGLQSNEFNSNAALKSSTGTFYFGGISGFNTFRPEDIRENKTPPSLVIQGYSIFENHHLPQDRVNLAYSENYITFSFAALEFSSPEKVKYKYKLEGFDEDWINSDQGKAHYTNLDPGRYRFLVQASNPDGYWTAREVSMIVNIDPPFWKTWWFMVFSFATLAVSMYFIHRYRLEQSLKVERLRNKIASDLHDEVGSSLSRISIYSDLLQQGGDTPEWKNYLAGIGELSREVVTTMSDIVWSIDNKNDTLGSLIIRMKDFATEILQVRNIDLKFDVDGINEQTVLDPALKQNLYLIFKESVHNIVKHAKARHVEVNLISQNNSFKMVIKDDGCGFIANGKQKGNGLRNMKRRAETVQGEFEIQNQKGTTLILTRRAL